MTFIDLKKDTGELERYKGEVVQVEGHIVVSWDEQYLTDCMEDQSFKLFIKKPFLVYCIVNHLSSLGGSKYAYYSFISRISGRLIKESDGNFYLDDLVDIAIDYWDGHKGEANFEEIRLKAEKMFVDRTEDDHFRMFALREIASFAYKTDDLTTIKRLIDIIKDDSEDIVNRHTAYKCIQLVSTHTNLNWPQLTFDNNDVIGQIDWNIIEEGMV